MFFPQLGQRFSLQESRLMRDLGIAIQADTKDGASSCCRTSTLAGLFDNGLIFSDLQYEHDNISCSLIRSL